MKTALLAEKLRQHAEAVSEMAEALRKAIRPLGTKEQWSAARNLDDAAYDIWSAAGWLQRHHDRYEQEEE